MTLKFLCPPISTMNTNHGILKYHLFNHNDLDDTITSSFKHLGLQRFHISSLILMQFAVWHVMDALSEKIVG